MMSLQYKKLLSCLLAAGLAAGTALPALAAPAATPPTTVTTAAATGETLPHGGKTSVTLDVPTAGSYEIVLQYAAEDLTTRKVEYALTVDGSAPFEDADRLEAPMYYEDDGGVRTLSNGDQIAPVQKRVDGTLESAAYDPTGVRLDPYTVTLTAGAHVFALENLGNPFRFAGFRLQKPEQVADYAAVSSGYTAGDYTSENLTFEAEQTLWRNDDALTAKSDSGSIDLSPHSASHALINYIGGGTWSRPGQEIAWEIEVPQDGLYAIGFAFKQNAVINGRTCRHLKIDGKTPFAEAKALSFPYKTAWQYADAADANGAPYRFYLTAGKHTLSLAVTLADIAALFDRLSKLTTAIGDLYLDIVMITGETPDSNRDYELYKQIPDFETQLASFVDELNAISAELATRDDVNGELDGAVKNMARVAGQMHDHRYDSHLYLSTYYSYYQTLSSWLYDIKNMALALDRIVVHAPDTPGSTGRAGFFTRLRFGVVRFLNSFAGDYSTESLDDDSAETIKLWVNWGRDQVKVLNTMIQESFSPTYGINVRVEQVNASLVQGVISNNSPDLYLHLARTEPVNLAMRGVLYPLSEFADCEKVLQNFQPGAEVPYLYRDKLYALPDTQSFQILFCRDDILAELGLKAPETWDEFLDATSIVQRKNMNAYLPYTRITAATTVNTGAGGLSIFPTMLLQQGENLYNEAGDGTNLASLTSVQTFRFWTDFYTKYRLNPDVNFYQRFRVGTIPLGVAPYTQYLTFAVAAPEIAEKWSVHPLPGVRKADGSIDRTSAGAGTGCAIMNSSKHKEAAWTFLKWWTSADAQYSYSAGCEAALGESGRVATSNVEALSRLSWDRDDLAVILEQWKAVREIEEVPGSYYVSRSIDQAFWAVKNGTATEKEAITDWARTSDDEIRRKLAEYAPRGEKEAE